jgi:hypothetical protein
LKCYFCEKTYLSKSALNNHLRSKHKEEHKNIEKGKRGRPIVKKDFQTEEYPFFFQTELRRYSPIEDRNHLIQREFNELYNKHSNKFIAIPLSMQEHPILSKLLYIKDKQPEESLKQELKQKKNIDIIFIEYLQFAENKTNENYFSLILKLILLLREFLLKVFSNLMVFELNNEMEFNDIFLDQFKYETIPDFCNDFYQSFLASEENNFFDMKSNEKVEILEIIQHFCIWLRLNKYTKSRLSLIK